MNDDISRLLHDAAPEGPSPDDWADGARRRSGRRRTIGGMVAAVAVVALIIPVSFSLKGPHTTTVQATPSPSSNAPQLQSLQPAACTSTDGSLPNATLFPGHTLQEGAVRLWLCAQTSAAQTLLDPQDGNHEPFAVVGPPEPLRIGVEDAVAAFNALTLSDGQVKKCAPLLGPQKAVVVEYPDGKQEVLTEGGCGEVGGRVGWNGLFSTLTGLWEKQRSLGGAAFTTEVQVCPATQSLLQPRPEDSTRGYVCPDGPQRDLPFKGQRPLPSQLVSDIAEEISATETVVDGYLPDLDTPALVLLNPFGDPVSLNRTPGDWGGPSEWQWADGDGAHVWTASTELAARIHAELMDASPMTSTPSQSAVTPSPQPSIPYDVELISYRHTTLAAAHPDVFAGQGFSENGKTAELYYARGHETEAKELAAQFATEGDRSALVPRQHSWSDLLEQRREVLSVLEKQGIEAVEAVPEPFENDGILLLVSPGQLNDDGSVGSDADWSALTAAGVVKVEVDSYPAPSTVAGIPVIQDSRSWYNLPLTNVDGNGSIASAVLQARADIFAGAAYSLFYDYVELWVDQDHLAEARAMLVAADVDMGVIRLTPARHTLQELTAQALRVFDEANSYGLNATGVDTTVESDGAVLWLADLLQLETLSPQQLRNLQNAGLVGVMEMGVETPVPQLTSPEPTHS